MKKLFSICILLCASFPLFAQIPTDSLVAWYPFNGNANDQSGNGHNGTVNGATLVPDRFGNANSAYSFNGTSSYITVPHQTVLNAFPITLNAWFKTTDYSGQIINKYFNVSGNGYALETSAGEISSYYYCPNGVWVNAGNSITPVVTDDVWRMATAIYDNSGLKLYLNGVLELTLPFENGSPTATTTTNDLLFGKVNDPSGSYYYQGLIDDIRIYNQVLSQEEITALYNEGQSWSCGDPITYEGQDYSTVQIGTQCWMAENLNVGTRINGTQNQTNNGTIEKYCYNDLESNCDVYGGLYQWDEMMIYTTSSDSNPSDRQGICPTGWHIPSDAEWCQLETFLDPSITCNYSGWSGIDAGGKMKETGTTHWLSPNTGATNSSGFTALGCGQRSPTGIFEVLKDYSNVWSATESSEVGGVSRCFIYNSAQIARSGNLKTYGLPTRCLKDESPLGLNSNFSATPLDGVAPLNVQFTDESTGNPSVWIWDFQNDGINDAFIQNPTFTYEDPGNYSVKLIVINATEADTMVKVNYITVIQGSTELGLIAYYPFNGNANDESGNGNDGNVNGATLTADRFGNFNSAYNFNGTTNYISINNALANFGTSDFTIAGWINLSSYSLGTQAIFAKRNIGDYSNFVEFDINLWKILGEIDESSSSDYSVVASTSSTTLSIWYFGTFVRESNTIRMYFNGNLEGTTTTPIIQNINNTAITTIGQLNGPSPFANFNGKLDDIRVYNRALSNDEILVLFNEAQIATPEICIVSVTPDEHNNVIWEEQSTDQIESYNIYRETTQTNVYEVIGSVAYADSSIFVDMTSNPNQRPYKYKLSAISTTGTETSLSNYHRTIHLTINQGPTGWNLIWSPYEGIPFNTYYIYRGTTSTGLTLLDSISGSFTSYTDINPPWGPLYYAVEIVNEEGCFPTRDEGYDRSRSNVQYNGMVGMVDNPEIGIKIFPNPANDVLNIQFDGGISKIFADLMIYDIQGKTMISKQIQQEKTNINIGNLNPGVYIIRVEYDQNLLTRKLIVY